MTQRVSSVFISFFTLFVVSGACYCEQIEWVGYQDGCAGQTLNPLDASFNDGNQWLGFSVPEFGDIASFQGVDPQGNGIPHNVHFGEFEVQTAGVGCNNATIPAGSPFPNGVHVGGGSYKFLLEDQRINTQGGGFSVGPTDSNPDGSAGSLEVIGPGTVQALGLFGVDGLQVAQAAAGQFEPKSEFRLRNAMLIGSPAVRTGNAIVEVIDGSSMNASTFWTYPVDGEYTAEIVVSGEDTSVRVSNSLVLGVTAGHSSLLVESGAELTTGRFTRLSSASGASSNVVVTGAGSRWEADGISMSNNTELLISDTAILESSRFGSVNGGSLVRLENGGQFELTEELQIQGDVIVGDNSILSAETIDLVNAGILGVVGESSLVTVDTINVGGFSILYGSGQINGDVVVSSRGRIVPGESPGTLSVVGNVGFNDDLTRLSMEISGPLENDYDRLVVSGNVDLGGILDITFTGGYVPTTSDEFLLVDASTVSGDFSSVNISGLPNGLGTDLVCSQDGCVLMVPEPAAITFAMLSMVGFLRVRHRSNGR